MLTIATVNVNGIRAALRKGMSDWVDSCRPDILLLQEVRAPEDILTDAFDSWQIAHVPSQIAGRAGVAILSRHPLGEIRKGLGQGPEIPVDTGRWVEADFHTTAGPLTVISAYLHSGVMGTPKMDEKYAHLDRVSERMKQLGQQERHVVMAGDINITHRDDDLANWRGNRKSAGTQPEERAHLDRWIEEAGFLDVHRHLVGPGPGPYTWWSSRGQAFVNDTGWRIDYQFATPDLAQRAHTAQVHRAETYESRWSDHAPLVMTYEIDIAAA